MKLKNIVEEDFVNYKKPSMFLVFPGCDFKCCKDYGWDVCQNKDIIKQPDIEISVEDIAKRYLDNPITEAIVCGGLEPFYKDSYIEMRDLINCLRIDHLCHDDIVIYTGYYPDEIEDEMANLAVYNNIIIKFGRFNPGSDTHLDDVLGVSIHDGQWAEKL